MATVATVTWNANTEPDLNGYRIYFGLYPDFAYATSSGALPKVNTSFLLDGLLLASDGLYSFWIDAFDTSVNVSPKSAPVSKRIIRTASKFVVRR